jgi:hypothetical protein
MNVFAAAFAFNYLSWALLCLGLPRYYRLHFGVEPGAARTRLLRVGGWLMIGAPLWLAIRRQGWDVGSVTWAATWMLSAIAWVLLQPYSPRLARAAAPLLFATAALCSWMP